MTCQHSYPTFRLNAARRLMTVLATVALMGGLYLLAPRSVFATPRNWTGSVSADWNDPNNWSPAGVPTGNDDLTLPLGALPHEPSITTVDAGAHLLTISTGRTLTIGDGRILIINGVSSAGNLINFGTLTATGAGLFRTQGSVTVTGTGTFTAPFEVNVGTTTLGSVTLGGTTTLLANGTLRVNASTTAVAVGDVTVGSFSVLTGLDSASKLTFKGSKLTIFGSVTVVTVAFGGTSQDILSTNLGVSSPFRILSGSTTRVGRPTGTFLSTLTIDPGAVATLNPGGGSGDVLALSGPGTPLVNNGTLSIATQCRVYYDGSTPQTVATANVDYWGILIGNPAGVTLSSPTTVAGKLELIRGVFSVGSNLTLGNGAGIYRYNGSLAGSPNFGAIVDVF